MVAKKRMVFRVSLACSLVAAALCAWMIAAGASGTKWSDYAVTEWYDAYPNNDTYTIDTAAKLAGVSKLVNSGTVAGFNGKILKIAANMDLSAHEWVPIGTEDNPFQGNLSAPLGESYTLSGVLIDTDVTYAGLVGYAAGATIGGFTIDGNYQFSSASEAVYAGSVVGKITGNGTLFDINSSIQMEIEGQSVYAGGVAGYAEGTVSNSNFNGTLSTTGTNAVTGGIVGYGGPQGLTIKRVSNNAPLTSESAGSAGEAIAGGIVGQSVGMLEMEDQGTPILNEGTVTALSGQQSYAGGIVGKADQVVTFSMSTTNRGTVTIDASQGSLSAAGGLVGAITSEMGDNPVNINFASSGNVTNNGGTEVYTGGIAGLLNSTLVWQHDVVSAVAVQASGAANVHSGGLIGHAERQVQWGASVRNEGDVTVSPWSVDGSLGEAFTGGMIGSSSDRILFESIEPGAYGNRGAITVTGDNGLYTGGIAGNRTFVRTNGAADNVISSGPITVTGDSRLHTGGYVGTLTPDAADHSMSGLTFDSSIQVTAAASSATNELVATGGIVGFYEKAVDDPAVLSELSFAGHLDSQGGGEYTYTGGVAGYIANGTVTGGHSGAEKSAHATIVSDGRLGGIAGYMNGDLDGPSVSYLSLTARTAGSYAGGVAAQAQGTITGVLVGDEAGTSHDTVQIGVDDAAGNTVGFIAGGIVGTNVGELTLGNSKVVRTALLNESGRSDYTLGGIAGSLNADAVAGATEALLTAEQLTIEANASNSIIGGAIGSNDSTDVVASTTDVTITVAGDNLVAGGVIGLNEAVLNPETTQLNSLRAVVTATGSEAQVGGIAGHNTGGIINATATDGVMTLAGSSNRGGGVAGTNHGEIADSGSVNMMLMADAAGAAIGGIVGVSEPSSPGGSEPVISNSQVLSREALFGTVTAQDVRIGGIVGNAINTEITEPVVKAENSDYVILTLDAPGIRAGGISGHTEGGSISGEGSMDDFNLQQLFATTTTNANEVYLGGITGYNVHTAIDSVYASVVNFSLGGVDDTAGGISGYFQGTDSAVISDSYMDRLGIRGTVNADGAVIGGAIGFNDGRAIDADADPAISPSTLQNTRIIGNINNSSSPVIDNRATNAIVGGMVGENHSLVANNSVADKIAVHSRGNGSIIGGHTGVNREGGTLYYTYANANLSVQGLHATVGGLAGLNEGAVMSSYVDTDVTGQAEGTSDKAAALGGLVGINEGLVDKSYSVSNVSANGVYTMAGGLVGEQLGGTIRYSYVGKNINANQEGSFAGGFAGRIEAGEIMESYSAANVIVAGGAQGGGFAGRYDNASKNLLYKVYYIKDDAAAINKDLPDFADGHFRWLNVPARLSTLLEETLRDRTAFPELSGWSFMSTGQEGDASAIWRYGSTNAEYLYPELIREANSGGGSTPVNASLNWYTRNPDAITFEIHSEAELAGLAELVNGTVLGRAREDFAGRTIRVANPIHIQSEDWTSIGASEATPFEGTFDGGGYLIDGLAVEPGQAMSGLFGVVGESGTLDNVVLEPRSIKGTGFAGSIAAVNHGTLSRIKIELTEETTIAGGTVGGLVGSHDGSIENIVLHFPQGAIIEAVGEDAAGGTLFGDNGSDIVPADFSELVLLGTVRSSAAGAAIGGYVGRQSEGAVVGFDIKLNHIVSSSGANGMAGGLVGQYMDGELSDIAFELQGGSIEASGTGGIAGGIVGRSEAGNTMKRLTFTASPSAAPVSGSIVGAIVGSKEGQAADLYDIEAAAANGASLTTPAGAAEASVGGLFGAIRNVAAFDLDFEGSLNARSVQANIGGIAGTGSDSLLRKAVVEPDIVFEASGGQSAVGGIAGAMKASDRDLSFELSSKLPFYVGIYEAVVPAVEIKANATGSTAEIALGGIAGELSASVYFSESSATLKATGAKLAAVGGIAGKSSGIVVSSETHSGATASDNTIYYVGGAVGLADGGEIHYTHVTAADGAKIDVSKPVTRLPDLPTVYAGGFIGEADGVRMSNITSDMPVYVASANVEDSIYAGGFAGALGDNAALTNGELAWAYATGNVESTSKTIAFAGGFAGLINRYDVSNAYASGVVSNAGFDTRTGGFAGAVEREATIENGYGVQSSLSATGVNHATRAYIGGFAGYNDGDLDGVYANSESIALSAAGASAYKGALLGYQYRDGSIADAAHAADIAAIGHNVGSSSGIVRENRLGELNLDDWQLRVDTTFLLSGTEEPYLIANPYQLFTAVLLANDATGLDFYRLYNRFATATPDSDIELGADIDLTGMTWKPFVDFREAFDGAGYAITGLSLSATGGPQGFMTVNYGEIVNLRLVDAMVVSGTAEADTVGLIAGFNADGAVIANVTATGSASGGIAGGIAGLNEGGIDKVNVTVEVVGNVAAGGITGINKGAISVSSSTGSVRAPNAGGIAGENGTDGEIANVFSYSKVKAEDASDAAAGGIAGVTSGSISNALFSGNVAASGSGFARAGGIAGHAEAGSISDVVAAAEATAGTNGIIARNLTFFGGIAGQKDAGATIADAFYNRQMLKTDTAYYDATGTRVAGGSDAGAIGLTGAELSASSLPSGLDSSTWQAASGYYPQLQAFEGELRSRVGAVATMLPDGLTIYGAIGQFSLTQASGIQWSAIGASLTLSGQTMTGKVTAPSGEVVLTAAAAGQPEREVLIRRTALPFELTASAPTFSREEGQFEGSIELELATTETDGLIYYTINGTEPTPGAAGTKLYDAPFELKTTTTVKAIVIAEDKEPSSTVTGRWMLKPSFGGGGGVFMPPPQPVEPQMTIGDREIPLDGKESIKAAVNSIVKLTVPDDAVVYYTTDGSEPTKNSPVYTGEIWVTGDMTIKFMTSKDDTVYSVRYVTKLAEFDLKPNVSEIRYMAGKGSSFRPDAAITRQELITALAQLIDFESTPLASTFGDVTKNNAGTVAKFASAGIVQGYPDGTFQGDKGLTRAEFVVMLSRILGLDIAEEGAAPFSDTASHWSAHYVRAFVEAGYVNGYPDGTFRPDRLLSRAEAVVLLNNILNTATKANASIRFTDVPENHWAYEDIKAAAKR